MRKEREEGDIVQCYKSVRKALASDSALTLRVTAAVDTSARVDVSEVGLSTQFAVNSRRVVTTVDAVTPMTSSLKQLLVEVALV